MTTAKGRTVLAQFPIYYTDTLVSLGPQQAALLCCCCVTLRSLLGPSKLNSVVAPADIRGDYVQRIGQDRPSFT